MGVLGRWVFEEIFLGFILFPIWVGFVFLFERSFGCLLSSMVAFFLSVFVFFFSYCLCSVIFVDLWCFCLMLGFCFWVSNIEIDWVQWFKYSTKLLSVGSVYGGSWTLVFLIFSFSAFVCSSIIHFHCSNLNEWLVIYFELVLSLRYWIFFSHLFNWDNVLFFFGLEFILRLIWCWTVKL